MIKNHQTTNDKKDDETIKRQGPEAKSKPKQATDNTSGICRSYLYYNCKMLVKAIFRTDPVDLAVDDLEVDLPHGFRRCTHSFRDISNLTRCGETVAIATMLIGFYLASAGLLLDRCQASTAPLARNLPSFC